MNHGRPFRSCWLALLIALVGLGATGCVQEYDFERPEYERGTLGEELWGIWHKDARRASDSPQAKAALLEREQQRFVESVDAIAPDDQLTAVDQFLKDVMSLVDEGLVPSLTRKIQAILLEARQNPTLIAALANDSRPDPETFFSASARKSFLGHTMAYPRMAEVATRTTDVLLAHDGLDPNGRFEPLESAALNDLLLSLTDTLLEARSSDPDDSLAVSLRDFLLVEDPRFAPADTTEPIWVARYDRRGYPKVPDQDDWTGTPFYDDDGDGLADLGPNGGFRLRNGQEVKVKAFADQVDGDLLNRDALGRGYWGDQNWAFEYVDLRKTALGYLLRQLSTMSGRQAMWDIVEILPPILGAKIGRQDAHGAFSGYPVDNPMTQAAFALFHMLDFPELPAALDALARFVDQHTSEIAGLMYALSNLSDTFAQHPGTEMADNQTLGYDLLPILEEIAAEPELWADFMSALKEPVTARSGEAMLMLLEYSDSGIVPERDGPYDACFHDCKARHDIGTVERFECIRACPNGELFSQRTDFDAPESEQSRSMLQKLFHLLRDTQGQPYALSVTSPGWASGLPPLIKLEGSAEAFLRSIAGNLVLSAHIPQETYDSGIGPLLDLIGADNVAQAISMMTDLFGAHLDTRPTPDQITRLFNQPELRADLGVEAIEVALPECKDGFIMANHLAELLYASEASGLIDALYPLTKAFSDHDREDLLARLFVVVHEHYSSRTDLYRDKQGRASPMKGSNLRSYERALRDEFADGKLMEALYRFGMALDRFKTDTRTDLPEHLRKLVHNGVRTDPGFETRSGEVTMELADGGRVHELSRMHALSGALGKMVDRVTSEPRLDQHFDNLLSTTHDVMVRAEWPDGGPPAFSDPGAAAFMSHLMHFLADRAAEMEADGELSTWLTVDTVDSFESLFDARGLPAFIDLGAALFAPADNRELTEHLLDYMLGTPAGRAQTAMGIHIVLVYSLQQDVWVPLSRFIATVIDPQRTWQLGGTQIAPYAEMPLVTHVLRILHDAVERDPAGHGLDLFARGFALQADGSVPFAEVFGVIADYFRHQPDATGPYTEADYQRVFGELAAWLGDDVHGLEQLYDIIGQRVR